eukprot:NODE_228_length_12276_cov_0.305337.p3 type:complete len:473 gc:universal NODE_228_length_12276_cov_0.305337:6635-5217(-)
MKILYPFNFSRIEFVYDLVMMLLISVTFYQYFEFPMYLQIILTMSKLFWCLKDYGYVQIIVDMASKYLPYRYTLLPTAHIKEHEKIDNEREMFKTKSKTSTWKFRTIKDYLWTSGSRSARSHHLDALRGFAAIIVVIFHVLPELQQFVDEGYLKAFPTKSKLHWFIREHGKDMVPLFMVLSGYIICQVHWTEKRSTNLPRLIIGRATRFYPMHLLCDVIFKTFTSYTFLHYFKDKWERMTADSLLNCWGLTMYWGVDRLSSVRASGCNPPAWSLSVEWLLNLFMYFVIRIFPIYWALFIFEMAAYYCAYGYFQLKSSTCLLGHPFFIGVIYYKSFSYFHTNRPIFQLFWDACTLYLLTHFYEMVLLDEYSYYNIGVYGLFFIITLDNSLICKYLIGLFHHFGTISFAMYLIHMPALQVIIIAIGAGFMKKVENDTDLFKVIFLIYLGSVFVHYKFEKPVKNQLDKYVKSKNL